ncbi:MAG: flagellar assembly factor FliW [Actinomycetota bacterium]|nr:flagellar assembly factor FliW [Actinomycetota bacterium]
MAMASTDEIDTEEMPENKVILFDEGIPGLPECHRFVLLDLAPDSAFQVLQSVDSPEVSMIVTVPWLFFPDYAPELSDVEQASLAIGGPEDVALFCSVVLTPDDKDTVFVNLMGPFVVNPGTRRGCQFVLAGSGYPLRAPVKLPEVPH